MPLRQRATGAGLQVALESQGACLVESQGACLVGEFDDDVQLPGSSASRVGAATSVVVGEAYFRVAGEADVELWVWLAVPQHVDDRLSPSIVRSKGKAMPVQGTPRTLELRLDQVFPRWNPLTSWMQQLEYF